jgi:predicted flavoprotein YhiN
MLSDRLAAALSERLPQGAIGDMKDATLIEAARTLKTFTLTPTGNEGYAKAEVMVGGVSTDTLSQQTMECRTVPGLFFVGEAVDVTGWLGGYNFQWAWSSGWAAGQAL